METITASLKIDSAQAEKKLEQVREKIAKLERELNDRKTAQGGLDAKADELANKYAKAAAELERLKAIQSENTNFGIKDTGLSTRIKEQTSLVASLQKELEKAGKEADKNAERIGKIEESLQYANDSAGQYVQQIKAAKSPTANLAKKTAEIKDNTDRIFNRIKGLFRRVLFFSVIAKGIRMIRDYIVDVIKVNPQATEAIARLKGALLAMAQPIIEFVIPILIKLINVLTRVINKVTSFFATLSGKSLSSVSDNAKALYEQTEALNATGSAAKEAKKQLAGFDELNILSENDTSGGSSADISPIFPTENDGGSAWVKWLEEHMREILYIVVAIGAALIAWKIGSMFSLNLMQIVAVAAILAGLFFIIHGFIDAFNNGATFDNIMEIVGGLVLVGTAIAFLTGSAIPLIITGIASVVLILSYLGGTADQVIVGIKDIFSGLVQFVKGVFTGDMKAAFDGLKTMFKGVVNTLLGVAGGLVNAIIRGLNWLIDKINSIKFDVPDWVPLIGGRTLSPNIGRVREWTVPKLAQGSVIPPNKEFLAMLGDNKSEQEVVSPLSTMKQAFLEAMRESGGGSNKPVNIYLDGKLLATSTTKYQTQYARAKG